MSRAAAAVAVVVLACACTDSDPDPAGAGGSPAEVSTGSTSEGTAPSETPTSDPLPDVHSRLSLPALMRQPPDGGRPRVLRTEYANDAYTRYDVSYRSDALTVSGVLIRPRGEGPFPGIVLNHGYIEPSVYVTGQGLMREQDALARAGFMVLHTDYRGHAASDPASDEARETRLGYTRDTMNAVASLKRLDAVDPERVALLGRSMGGGVTYNALVAKPGFVRAAVVFAPVSSDFVDNLRRWTVPERPAAAAAFFRRHGTPKQEPDFYRGLSARTYFDRISEPVMIHHGTSDDSCPIAWSRTTLRLLRRAGVDSRLHVYQGEQHAFGPQWPLSMDRTVRFLRREMRT